MKVSSCFTSQALYNGEDYSQHKSNQLLVSEMPAHGQLQNMQSYADQ